LTAKFWNIRNTPILNLHYDIGSLILGDYIRPMVSPLMAVGK